jgi:hypothetical protein
MGAVTGSGATVAYESGYYGTSGGTTIANGANALLPFAAFEGGTATLNISTPTHPLVLKAGLFVVTAEVTLTSVLTAGGSFGLTLTLDFTGEAIEMKNVAVSDSGVCEVSNSWVMAAGAQFRLLCRNFDGAASRDFYIENATISRVGSA